MEALGMGLAALGKSIGTCAVSFAFVYIVGIGCKTFLIYTGKAKMDEFKTWVKFRDGRRENNRSRELKIDLVGVFTRAKRF